MAKLLKKDESIMDEVYVVLRDDFDIDYKTTKTVLDIYFEKLNNKSFSN